MSSDTPVKETKAQRVERLKREKNPWEAFDELRALRARGLDAISAGVGRHVLPLVGRLHPGRRRRRGGRQGRRGQVDAVLHGAHPHPERPAARRTRCAPSPTWPSGTRAASPTSPSARTCSCTGSRSRPCRSARDALAHRPDHDGRLRRRHAQHHRLPARRLDADELVDASPLARRGTRTARSATPSSTTCRASSRSRSPAAASGARIPRSTTSA